MRHLVDLCELHGERGEGINTNGKIHVRMGEDADGTVFIGESDRRAKLFMFVPGDEVMPGVLNPTNPR